MKISIIETGFFKLDGGAMFGVVPKVMWKKLNPPDENNLCTWAMRCLLIDTGTHRILIDTGMGDKQDKKFRSYFHPHGDASLLSSLAQKGYRPKDITDVFITHMHFDHVGGAVKYNEHRELVPTFPNAVYWTNKKHFDWATNPNPREAASFLKENILPLQEAGVLKYIQEAKEDLAWMENISLRFVYGHTEAMMVPIIRHKGKTLVYCADLISSSMHIGLPYIMAYDIHALTTLREKTQLLNEAVEQGFYLFFEHDPRTACVTVKKNERGRIVVHEEVDIEAVFNEDV